MTGCESARVLLLDPDELDAYLTGDRAKPPRGLDGQGWGWIYPVLPVAASLAWLRAAAGLVRLPEDGRAFVEAATHPEALAPLAERGRAWSAALDAMREEAGARQGTASLQWIEWSSPYWSDRCPSSAAATRLGGGTVTVPVRGLASPFDQSPLEALPVPMDWLHGLPPEFLQAVGDTLTLGPLVLRYTGDGLQRA